MSVDVKNCLKNYCKNVQLFSIVLSESTNIKDTTQPAVYVCGVNSTFDIFEGFVQLVPIKGATTGVDILEALLTYTEDTQLELSKLVCVSPTR